MTKLKQTKFGRKSRSNEAASGVRPNFKKPEFAKGLPRIFFAAAFFILTITPYASNGGDAAPAPEIVAIADKLPAVLAPFENTFQFDLENQLKSSIKNYSPFSERAFSQKLPAGRMVDYARCETLQCKLDLIYQNGIDYVFLIKMDELHFAVQITCEVYEIKKGEAVAKAVKLSMGMAGLTQNVSDACAEAAATSQNKTSKNEAKEKETKKEEETKKENKIEEAPYQRLIFVPAGQALLGPYDQFNQPEAGVKEFFLDALKVRYTDYLDCVRKKKCEDIDFANCRATADGAKFDAPASEVAKKFFIRNELPAVCVSKKQAEDYCKFRNGRLPTELEWIRAARGNDSRAYPWGDELPDKEKAKYCDKSEGCLTVPELKKSTGFPFAYPVSALGAGKGPFGHIQMAGNVWEWTANLSDAVTKAGNEIPDQLYSKRDKLTAVHGGSFAYSREYMFVWKRKALLPETTSFDLGFRCASDK